MRSNVREMSSSREDTGLPTKDETSEKIVLSVFLHSGFLVGLSCGISVFNYLVNNQNTQLTTESRNEALIRHIFRVLGRLGSLILCG